VNDGFYAVKNLISQKTKNLNLDWLYFLFRHCSLFGKRRSWRRKRWFWIDRWIRCWVGFRIKRWRRWRTCKHGT